MPWFTNNKRRRSVHYIPDSLLLADMLIKLAGHAEDRMIERTDYHPDMLIPVRQGLQGKNLPRGSHHVRLPNGGFVVVKDVGKRDKPRHVVATVYSEDMSPPGYDITYDVMDAQPEDVRVVKLLKGDGKRHGETYHAKQKRTPNSHSFTETKTLSSVKVASIDLEDVNNRLRALQHDPDTLQQYVEQIRRENVYLQVNPHELPMISPPSNDSEETKKEVNKILDTMEKQPLSENFVNRASDHVNNVFYDVCGSLRLDPLEDVAEDLAQDILKIAMYMKYKFLRPRPYQLAPYFEGNIQSLDMSAEESPAYPSGHSMMGFALSKLYANRYPDHASTFIDLGRKVGLSRIQAGVHYPSDVTYAKHLTDFIMGEDPIVEKKASLMGAAIGGAVAGGDAKQRAAGAAGGGVGGTVGGLAGLGAGMAAAKPLGLAKGIEGKTLMDVAKAPIQSTKALGGKGLGLLLGLNTLGAGLGGYVGGKMGANAYNSNSNSKLKIVKTPNLDKLARS